jgi:protein-disulfide isomerase
MSPDRHSRSKLAKPYNPLIIGALVLALASCSKSGATASDNAGQGFSNPTVKTTDSAPNVKQDYQPGSTKTTDMVAPKTTESKNTGGPADNTLASIKNPEAETVAAGDPNPLNVIAYGSLKAPVTIIEYGSFSCPHCAEFDTIEFPKIKQAYIDKGLVRLVFRPYSRNGVDVYAGLLVSCLQPDRRTAMVDKLFRQQADWVPFDVPEDQAKDKLISSLKDYGRDAGLSDKSVDQCLSNTRNQAWLQAAMSAGNKQWADAGGDPNQFGTPAFFINGKKYNNMAFSDWQKLLDPMVSKTN